MCEDSKDGLEGGLLAVLYGDWCGEDQAAELGKVNDVDLVDYVDQDLEE